mmetsp:Transcript_8824/g.29104  ORF Transcript_8824/g.29104 Transcript_8824/m.29104 type:complete len:227 (-) Transcript_8824:26-706(-)
MRVGLDGAARDDFEARPAQLAARGADAHCIHGPNRGLQRVHRAVHFEPLLSARQGRRVCCGKRPPGPRPGEPGPLGRRDAKRPGPALWERAAARSRAARTPTALQDGLGALSEDFVRSFGGPRGFCGSVAVAQRVHRQTNVRQAHQLPLPRLAPRLENGHVLPADQAGRSPRAGHARPVCAAAAAADGARGARRLHLLLRLVPKASNHPVPGGSAGVCPLSLVAKA